LHFQHRLGLVLGQELAGETVQPQALGDDVGLLLGAAGLLPVIWGAVLHNASTILVVGNSLRLLFYRMDVDG